MEKWARYNFQPSIPIGKNGQRITGSTEHIHLSYEAACEGMVLLKNDGSLLPLTAGTKVALFGRGHIDYIKGGGGSGVVTTNYTTNILQGFQNSQVSVFPELAEFYRQCLQQECDFLNSLDRKTYAKERLMNKVGSQEPLIPDALLTKAAAFTDIAIVTISRYSCEKYERNSAPGGGDFYLSSQETALIDAVKANFSKIIIILNVGGIVDTAWIRKDPKIGACLLAWQPGIEGGQAIADIICGICNPCGKLTDTFAQDYLDYPSASTFMDSDDYVNYYEDIFVGYRYFETIPFAKEKVNYCFGFGLSYTDFTLKSLKNTIKDDKLQIDCIIQNIGNRAGKEVLQVYGQAPAGRLGKPRRELVAFIKTKELLPGEEQPLTIVADPKQLSSFDDTGIIAPYSFVMESGDYHFYIGTSIDDTVPAGIYSLAKTAIVYQATNRNAPSQLPWRLTADGKKESLPMAPAPEPRHIPDVITASPPAENVTLFDVAEGKVSLDSLIAQLSDEEMTDLLYGHNTVSVSPTNGIGGAGRKSRFAIPLIPTADGPAGLRIPPEVGIGTTAFPCATLLACSWNLDLVEKVGAAIASEVRENNIGIYLAPALNIHRDPLCGRNFEYYSEDPLLSGKMAAACVRGIQSQGVAATIKHFACNGKETNRRNSDSRVSQRALREIYLRGFEIAVKESNPMALMTAYNMVNGIRSSQNYDLITGILREEWGFQGLVMTDWHVFGSERDEIMAGNDVKMPEALNLPEGTLSDMPNWMQNGYLPKAYVQASAKRVLELILQLS